MIDLKKYNSDIRHIEDTTGWHLAHRIEPLLTSAYQNGINDRDTEIINHLIQFKDDDTLSIKEIKEIMKKE